jgi:hypothetical protein
MLAATNMSISTYQMNFNGEVLERGFWLYVWKISKESHTYLYIGRTGDSSSPNASSPFNRIGQHLDFRENAKGNSLAKRLKEANVNPKTSKFRMLALGPLFPEQDEFEAHKPFRDQMATFEFELSRYLKNRGYNVLGTHHKGSVVQTAQLSEIKSNVMKFLQHESS